MMFIPLCICGLLLPVHVRFEGKTVGLTVSGYAGASQHASSPIYGFKIFFKTGWAANVVASGKVQSLQQVEKSSFTA